MSDLAELTNFRYQYGEEMDNVNGQIQVKGQKVAILIPCLNEEKTIGNVLDGLLNYFSPESIYVFDNASTDKTTEIAKSKGVRTVYSPQRGKGNVVKHMFASVNADCYIMLDGDDTYFAKDAPLMLEKFNEEHLDMLIGDRARYYDTPNLFRRFHTLGNLLITSSVSKIFNTNVRDIFSGYRVFSREFVKNIPLKADGFDIEAEMTLQALSKRYRVGCIDVTYGARPEGSFSKLNTISDGLLVIKTVLKIVKNYVPLLFYSMLGLFFLLCSLISGVVPIIDYFQTHYVYHIPLAILATGLAIIGILCIAIGMILDTMLAFHNEQYIILKKISNSIDEHLQ
jgi:glycosyltransferase involved in cell wall biosynthesis